MLKKKDVVFSLGLVLLAIYVVLPALHAMHPTAASPVVPVAMFTYSPGTPIINENVVFDASESYDPDGTVVSYAWDFGDGTNITIPEPLTHHAYALEGNYTVTLTVTDDEGLTDATQKTLVVIKHPLARFTYSPTYPTVSETVVFNASESTPNGGTIVSYFWDFGDGTNVTETDSITTHIYTADGNYTVTLKITDSEALTNTCSKSISVRKYPVARFAYSPGYPIVGEIVIFSASGSTPDGGTIVSYFWDFGDETNGTGMIVTHTYATFGNYTVTLTIIDSEELTDTALKLISVRAYPVAYITYTPLLPLVNETVRFDASLSTPNGGTILSYEWDFGDGSSPITETDPITSHVYIAFGTYGVTLTIKDSEDLSDTCSETIRVLIAPKANFTYSPTTPIINETITFDASGSYDPDGTIESYKWDFGDGNATIVSNPTISHVYTSAATYNVTLTIIDNDGLTDKTSKLIIVYTFIPTHDVSIATIKPSANWVYQGRIINITVIVTNEGTGIETLNVTLYYNNISIETQGVTYLIPGENATLTFSWNTTGVYPADYIISAVASVVPGETDTPDNTLVDGVISVLWVGDVNHDGKVDMRDIARIARAFGSYIGDPRYNPDYDLNNDGKIDMKDLATAARNFGQPM